MRVLRVRAKAFGALRGDVLDLAPGMTVIHGQNEAGKSTWHSAIFAGLCGLRRARGGLLKEDKIFADRYRPWSGDEWAVSIEVELDDGRRLEFVQNLEDQVGCRVVDLVTGREVASELGLVHDGAPDGARLFGLTRRTLRYSMFVRQAEIVGILDRDRPHELREDLERAAATAGADETAERAIRTLAGFQKENVGPDRPSGPKPLGRALAALEQAELWAEEAASAHADYLTLLEQKNTAEVQAAQAQAQLAAARRAIAERDCRRLAGRVDEARAIHARFPDGAPPDPSAGRALRERVSAALGAFARLDPTPAAHEIEVPQAESAIETGGIEVLELRHLADLLDAPVQDVDDDLAREHAALAERLSRARSAPRRGRWVPALVGLVVAAAGAALIAFDQRFAGGMLLALGATLCSIGLLRRGLATAPADAARLAALEARLGQWRDEAQRASRQRESAQARLAAAGLGQDPAALRRLAAGLDQARSDAARREGAAAERFRARAGAEDEIRTVAAAAGVAGRNDSIQSLIEGLSTWKERSDVEIERRQHDRETWVRLEQLLDGRTPAELVSELALKEARLRGLPDSPIGVDPALDPETTLQRAEEAYAASRGRFDALRGRVEEREHMLPDVAGAEENLEHARRVLERLRALEATLDKTLSFLARAREEVQRDFAPHLAAAIRSRLARITGGRYVDATVDPATLEVQVRDAAGDLHPATLVSHGTMEQIYLLLRVALAERLVVGLERAPLILDDVTAQADPERTAALLDLLHELSGQRQIVLFSQEAEVRAWAQARLDHEVDRLIDLSPKTAPVP